MPRKASSTVSVRINATVYPQLVATAEQFGCNVTTLLTNIVRDFISSGRDLTVTYQRATTTPTLTPQSVAPITAPKPRFSLKGLSDEEQAEFMDSDFDSPEEWLAAKQAKPKPFKADMSVWFDDDEDE